MCDKNVIKYSWNFPKDISDVMLKKMSELYSNHYGVWGNLASKPGEQIRLGPRKIKELIVPKDAKIALATKNGELVGYAIAIQKAISDGKIVSWVTQFVVHRDFRNIGIGKKLLFSIWSFSDHYAWGIVTSNPYAIRALEKTSNRRCTPIMIKAKVEELIQEIGIPDIPYIDEKTEVTFENNVPEINTRFFVDHAGIDDMIHNVSGNEKEWLIGKPREGREWLAFTFKEQSKIKLTKDEVKEILNASETTAMHAYSRMLMSEHKWASYTTDEIKFLKKHFKLHKEHCILDVGCGIGRHTIALAENGYDITGVDYVATFIEQAKNDASAKKLEIPFLCEDIRVYKFNKKFDFILCLYDVIGSFAEEEENNKIIRAISDSLKSGGRALISVMNYDYSASRARPENFFVLEHAHDKLLDLVASNTMESTGNIFKSKYNLIDSDTKIIYRKEQFKVGTDLPVEVIVRDRRYNKNEICEILLENGLDVVWSKYVKAGNWDEQNIDEYEGKEILLLCEKAEAKQCSLF